MEYETDVTHHQLSSEKKEPSEVLEAYNSTTLLISGNSSHLLPWHTKLGLRPGPCISTLHSLTADGGVVAALDFVVIKVGYIYNSVSSPCVLTDHDRHTLLPSSSLSRVKMGREIVRGREAKVKKVVFMNSGRYFCTFYMLIGCLTSFWNRCGGKRRSRNCAQSLRRNGADMRGISTAWRDGQDLTSSQVKRVCLICQQCCNMMYMEPCIYRSSPGYC